MLMRAKNKYMTDTQSYSNHVRWYPLFHFVVVPLTFLNLVWQSVILYQYPSWSQAMALVFAVTVILIATAGRFQSLKAQDRTIRLEERLRFRDILPPESAAQASELPVSKIIALRFASDGELPELVRRTLSGELATSKDIKLAITDWRPDHLRV